MTTTNLSERLPGLLDELARSTPTDSDEASFDPNTSSTLDGHGRGPRRFAVAAAAVVLIAGAGAVVLAQPGNQDTNLANQLRSTEPVDDAATTGPVVQTSPTDQVGELSPPRTNGVDLNADVDVESLIYEIEGMERDQRTGTPRSSSEVVALLEPIREAYGGIRIGDEFDLELVIPEETTRTFAFLPVVRMMGGPTYLIGWVDQTTFGTAPPDDLYKANIEFIYDDNGRAIGSMPFGERLPGNFPLPEHLEPLRN